MAGMTAERQARINEYIRRRDIEGLSKYFREIALADQTETANQPYDKALDFTERQYDDRAPWRQYGLDTLNEPEGEMFGPYNPDDEYSRFLPITTQYGGDGGARKRAFDKVQNGPDRIAMVREALDDFDIEGAPQLASRFQKVGQQAATLGRLGSGQVTTDLGDIQSDYERNRLLTRNSLVRDATEADVNDRFRVLDAAVGEDETGYRRAAYTADEKRGERGTRYSLGREGNDARYRRQSDKFNRGLAASQFGYGNDPSDAYWRYADASTNNARYFEEQQAERERQAAEDRNALIGTAASFIPGAQYARAGGQAYKPARANDYSQRNWG